MEQRHVRFIPAWYHTNILATATERERWWKVIGYEIEMLKRMTNIPASHPARADRQLDNSVSENVVLHTRNLCDFCTSRRDNDIKPIDLFDDFTDPKYDLLKGTVDRLREEYGTDTPETPRWVFNKMLAHPTKERDTGYNYTPYVNRILPLLQEVVDELERVRQRRF
jgi:hypothetical protein